MALLAAFASASISAGAESDGLQFARAGEAQTQLSVDALRRACGFETIEVQDPYYSKSKRFFAIDARCVLGRGFRSSPPRDANLFLRAADGYTRPAPAGALLSGDAWFAFADAELTRSAEDPPVWEPIDRRQVHPGPFYLIWSGPDQNDPHRYPWPYQLVTVDWAPLESEYPNLDPRAEAGSAAERGFALFRAQCVSCHAINGEGGRVGPDLNVPRSIVEYRPEEQIRAYIRDPESFRFTSMPSHEHLSDEDLDALVAYFWAMAERKVHPRLETHATGSDGRTEP